MIVENRSFDPFFWKLWSFFVGNFDLLLKYILYIFGSWMFSKVGWHPAVLWILHPLIFSFLAPHVQCTRHSRWSFVFSYLMCNLKRNGNQSIWARLVFYPCSKNALNLKSCLFPSIVHIKHFWLILVSFCHHFE